MFCFAASAQAADFTVGGSISNLVGSGLVLRLDTQVACLDVGDVSSVTNSPASGGPSGCLTTATEQCCTLSSFNGHATINPDGTYNCTATCGSAPPILQFPGRSDVAQTIPTETQTVSPPAHATSYVFSTAVSDGSTFTASVATQPSNPAQVCLVANTTGTISGVNVTNVNVTCTTVTLTVTATAGPNGSVSPPSQSVSDGSTATVTLTPNPHFAASATGCGGSLGSDGVTYTTGAIHSDCTVVAAFTAITHTVTATAGPNGTASPPSQSVNDGGTAVVTLTPNANFTASASGCGGSLGSDGMTYTTGAITADCTVAATFTAIPLSPTNTTLSLSPNPTLTGHSITASVTVSNSGASSSAIQTRANEPTSTATIAAIPMGTVAVSGGGQSCNAALLNGSGQCTLVYAVAGAYTVTATYPGDARNLPSAATASLTVNQPAPAVPTPTLGDIALVILGLAVLGLAWRRRSAR